MRQTMAAHLSTGGAGLQPLTRTALQTILIS